MLCITKTAFFYDIKSILGIKKKTWPHMCVGYEPWLESYCINQSRP